MLSYFLTQMLGSARLGHFIQSIDQSTFIYTALYNTQGEPKCFPIKREQ